MRTINFSHITDEKLFQLCRVYGARTLEWRHKFIGLLPEVHKRRLYEKKGCGSIFEFAAKFAGISEEQVRRVLNLEKKFEKIPVLKSLLESGEVSVNKLARVASIVTEKNAEVLAEQVRLLPQKALEVLVRDEKIYQKIDAHQVVKNSRNSLQEPLFETKSVRKGCCAVRTHTCNEFGFSDEVEQKLLELHHKGININQLFLEFLEKRELEIAQEKEQLAQEIHQAQKIPTETTTPLKPSRYIPKKVINLLQKEYGNICSILHCDKPSKQKHHTQRFALSHSHDPRYLAPLCKEHHLIAHTIDLEFHQVRQRAFI